SASTGLDHWPCMILPPGELSVQTTSSFSLFTAMNEGALGLGMLTCPSSTPLLVTTNTLGPTINGEQVARLCGKTPSVLIMSSFQMNLASCLSGSPSVSAQTSSQR